MHDIQKYLINKSDSYLQQWLNSNHPEFKDDLYVDVNASSHFYPSSYRIWSKVTNSEIARFDIYSCKYSDSRFYKTYEEYLNSAEENIKDFKKNILEFQVELEKIRGSLPTKSFKAAIGSGFFLSRIKAICLVLKKSNRDLYYSTLESKKDKKIKHLEYLIDQNNEYIKDLKESLCSQSEKINHNNHLYEVIEEFMQQHNYEFSEQKLYETK